MDGRSRCDNTSSRSRCAWFLYPSFFGKLLAPEETDAGNWNVSMLTVLVGVAFGISVIGMVGSIVTQYARAT
jgi:hypothetical protein